MKLVHPELTFCIECNSMQTKVPVLVVESPSKWREVQKEFLMQQNGEEGSWVLSENDKELKFSKSIEMILNPLQLEENQRKIMSAFLKSFAEKAVSEMHWKDGQELNTRIQMFFGRLETEYSFAYNIADEIDFSSLAKAMGIQIATEYETDLERLLQYCILLRELVQPKLLVFWNLHDYFTKDELLLFYDEIHRREWNVLLLEHFVAEKLGGEKWYIIDKDNCEIY